MALGMNGFGSSSNLYWLALSSLEFKLAEARDNGVISHVTELSKNLVYSVRTYAIRIGPEKAPLAIWDIEIDLDNIGDELIEKWSTHSTSCPLFKLLVPEIYKTKTETICAKHLTNYEVLSFRVETVAGKHSVIIDL